MKTLVLLFIWKIIKLKKRSSITNSYSTNNLDSFDILAQDDK